MRIFVGTWFFTSPNGEKLYYPGVGSDSDTWQFAKTYWHSLLTCLYSLSRSAKVASSTDKEIIPFVCLNSPPPSQLLDQIDYSEFIRIHGIEEFGFSPKSNVNQSIPFASQIHIYEVLATLYSKMSKDDLLILLDCDVYCAHFPEVAAIHSVIERGYYWFHQAWPSDYIVNGTSSQKLSRIIDAEMGISVAIDRFVGGEIFALTRRSLECFLSEAAGYLYLYNKYMLTEEVLNTAILHKLEWTERCPEKLIERIWTDKSNFCNLASVSLDVPFLHMPAEKQKGFYSFYHDVLLDNLGKDRVWPLPWEEISTRFRLI